MWRPTSKPRSNDSDRRLAEVVADAVVAAYVHEISDRHGTSVATGDAGTQSPDDD